MIFYRQGDVLINRIDSIPDGLKEVPRDRGRIVLAYGEVTGHAHAILDGNARLLAISDEEIDRRFLEITAGLGGVGVALVHEEHGTVTLAPGNYSVTRQREYSPQEIIRVAD